MTKSSPGQYSWCRTDFFFILSGEMGKGQSPVLCIQWAGEIPVASLNCPELSGENFSSREWVGRPHPQVSVGPQNGGACENSLSLKRRSSRQAKDVYFFSKQRRLEGWCSWLRSLPTGFKEASAMSLTPGLYGKEASVANNAGGCGA